MRYFYQKTELLFPHRSIASLEDMRDGKWQELVRRVASLPEVHSDSLAFALMMIRLCGCLRCNPGSYRASLGCSECARRVIRIMKGSDSMLLQRFRKARRDVEKYLKSLDEEKVATLVFHGEGQSR